MPDSKVHYLGCPENVMKLTLDEVYELAQSSQLTSLYVVGTANIDGKDQIINAVITTEDTPFYTLLGGMKAAADKLSGEINGNVELF